MPIGTLDTYIPTLWTVKVDDGFAIRGFDPWIPIYLGMEPLGPCQIKKLLYRRAGGAFSGDSSTQMISLPVIQSFKYKRIGTKLRPFTKSYLIFWVYP